MRHGTALPCAGGLAALAGAVLFAGWTWMAGQDASWDLQNYHDYAAYALLHWRYPLDVGMGGFQGYFNPLPYLVPYGPRHTLPPLAAGLLIAVLQSGAVAVAWMLSVALLPPGLMRPLTLCGLATALGATGATVLSEAGTSFADLQLSALVLGGLLLALVAVTLAVVVSSRRAKTPPVRSDRHMARAGAFLAASTTAWLGLFAIQRYAVALEVLSGVVLVMVVPRLVPGRPHFLKRRISIQSPPQWASQRAGCCWTG